ncbi:MAG: hypothetical protein M3115_01770 [Thermoproteota archaeon]|nr:hypothetical protein [Thermoproteota archaeon]MDQ4100902.1 hypothetical protein [Thermoproteota archaeon]
MTATTMILVVKELVLYSFPQSEAAMKKRNCARSKVYTENCSFKEYELFG